MLIETRSSPWRKLRATNFTPGTLANPAPMRVTVPGDKSSGQLDGPWGDGVVEVCQRGGGVSPEWCAVKPFGTDLADEIFNLCLGAGGTDFGSWEFLLVCELAVTLGNVAGTAGCAITATDFEADAITVTYGNDDFSTEFVSASNDVRGATARFKLLGCQRLLFSFGTNTAASANLLYRFF